MLTIFKNTKKQNAREQHVAEDKFLKSVIHICIRWQSGWAKWMQQKTEKLSINGKMMLLLISVSLTTGYSIYLIGNSLFGNPSNSFSVTPIKNPAYVRKNGDGPKYNSEVISKSEYEKIHQFSLFMDSLEHSPSGKLLRDSIIAHQPGLINQLQTIENIYQSQIKE